jgi:hypothetical protein
LVIAELSTRNAELAGDNRGPATLISDLLYTIRTLEGVYQQSIICSQTLTSIMFAVNRPR